MSERCERSFDEALLSGYLDRALTQGDEQRVRVHLEDCGTCQTALDEMTRLRDTTLQTEFKLPADEQWLETPKSLGSALSFGLGWSVVVIWAVGLLGYAVWHLMMSDDPLIAKVLIFGGWTGFGLLLVGVILDRWKAMQTDRYREVRK